MNKYLLGAAALSLAACASPELPTSGTPSAFDGKWAGEAVSPNSQCGTQDIAGEVRFGAFQAEIRNNSRPIGEIWGTLDEAGKLSGALGASGVSIGSAEIAFEGDIASGTWSGRGCSGSVRLSRQS